MSIISYITQLRRGYYETERQDFIYVIWGRIGCIRYDMNSLVSGDADARGGVKDATFRTITRRDIIIKSGYKEKAHLGLAPNGSAILEMYGDDQIYKVAYLGENTSTNNEMILQLQSKSKIDKRQVMMTIGENGGRFDSLNKIGESINSLEVGSGGSLDVRVKYENKK